MSFADDIRKFAEKAKRGYDEVVQESLVGLSASVIIKTPVRTGVTANSWRASFGAPDLTTLQYSGSEEQDTVIRLTAGEALGGTFFLVNNQPQIRRLEYESWSQRAPHGMVRVSIEEFQLHIDKAIANL